MQVFNMKYEITKYSDGQVSAKITKSESIMSVTIRGSSYEDLFKAASIKEAWSHEHHTNHSILNIKCLIGQRSDRRFNDSESFDLKVIANFINSMNYARVNILHPHSSVAPALIDNSHVDSPKEFILKAREQMGADILVSPDAGAYKDTYAIAQEVNSNLVAANKVRINGTPQIRIDGNVEGSHCLIVDDIADGGRTFIELAKKLKEKGAKGVRLYVTHGMFHFGFDELKEHIDHIYCTNSYRDIEDDFVTQYKVI